MLVAALAGAVLGGLNAFTLAGSGLIASMAKNRFLPLEMADRNDRNVLSKAVLAILAVNLLAPWAGREVINYIVDMSSMLAAIAYGYTCFISMRIAKTLFSRVLSGIGLAFSLGFVALLTWPGSAGQLSTPAMVVLIIWLALGSIVYLFGRRHEDELEITEAQWQAPELSGDRGAQISQT
jgi:amino acid transporter